MMLEAWQEFSTETILERLAGGTPAELVINWVDISSDYRRLILSSSYTPSPQPSYPNTSFARQRDTVSRFPISFSKHPCDGLTSAWGTVANSVYKPSARSQATIKSTSPTCLSILLSHFTSDTNESGSNWVGFSWPDDSIPTSSARIWSLVNRASKYYHQYLG